MGTRGSAPPITVTCGCGFSRETRAKHNSNWTCSECGVTQRVHRPGVIDKRTRAYAGPAEAGALPPAELAGPRSVLLSKTPARLPVPRPPAAPPALRPAPPPPGRPASRAAPARRERPVRPPQAGRPGARPRLARPPIAATYCELCKHWPLGPDDHPRLFAAARVYTSGNTPVDLCPPHLRAANDTLAAQGVYLQLVDWIQVPPGAPKPRRGVTAAFQASRKAIGA